jgi:CRISPR-associated protein Csm4
MNRLLRYPLRLQSALGSPLRSDTLSGQLLCAYREKHGEPALEDLIAEIKQGNLPFVLSDALPRQHLPVPTFPPVPRRLFQELADSLCGGDRYQALQLQKTNKKELSFLTCEYWQDLRRDGSLLAMLRVLFTQSPERNEKHVTERNWQQRTVPEMHNVIDRLQNTTLQRGGIFTVENTWMGMTDESGTKLTGKGMELDLYAHVRPDFQTELEDLLRRVGLTGYGRDASVGLGHLEVGMAEDASTLLECEGANCFLSLSTCSTTDGSVLQGGYYKIRPKFGKVWSGFGENAPFKKPILVLDPGSILRRIPAPDTTILQGVHPTNAKVIQYASGIFLPFVLSDSYSTGDRS